MSELVDPADKKNIWILYLEGSELTDISGPFSMNTFQDGLEDALRENTYDEGYDNILAIEINAKGRPQPYFIADEVLANAVASLEANYDDTFLDDDFDGEDDLDDDIDDDED